MKRFITILFLAIAFSSIAIAQEECKVPISIQLDRVSRNTMKNRSDRRWVTFKNILDQHGFTTDIHNTRVAISLVINIENEYCGVIDKQKSVEIRFSDTYSGKVFYTTKLDNTYCGSYSEVKHKVADEILNNKLGLDSLADSIRICVINAYEVNTKHMAEVAHDYAKQGQHDVALFGLAQFPSCCPSYPKIRDLMVAIFRDYMRKDHDALLDIAKNIWKYQESDSDARFVVSLLNSVKFTKSEQRKADRLFKKIAKEYPALDLKANKDYTFDPELKQIAFREAYDIAIEFGASDDIYPEEKKVYTPLKNLRYEYYHDYYYYDHDYYHDHSYDPAWYESMMDVYNSVMY